MGILSLLAAAVLAVACANVAGLLTSRAPVRAREIALRLAIGAGRPRLIRQLLTESSMIAAVGGLAGIPVGYAGISLLRQIQFPSDRFSLPPAELDHRALIYSVAIAMLSTVLCGLVPAIQTTRADLTTALKASGGDVSGGRRRLWGRHLLVTAQVAVSLVLLTISVFAYQVFGSELKQGLGFRTKHAALMTLDPGLVRYTPAQTSQFFQRLTERAAAVPGVTSAGLASAPPLGLFEFSWIRPEGHQFPAGQKAAPVYSSRVDEHYFDTMEFKILRGRGFTAQDADGAPRVAVVNETLAEHYWPGQNAVGKRFRWSDEHSDWVEVVGITPTSRYIFLGEPPTEFLYMPYRQNPGTNLTLVAATSGESASLIEPLRAVVRDLDPNMPVYDAQTMEHFILGRATSVEGTMVNIIGAMGLMGLTLAMVGLYGLMSYAVSRRTREIGIRMAVGADRVGVLRMVLRQGMVPALWGIALGLALSAGCGRLLMAAFPVNRQIGPASYGIVAPALLVVAMLAAIVPARRASRVDPITALRDE
jgi:predicted permease